MMTQLEYLTKLYDTIRRSGDPDKPFHYLGGPMTGIPQFNFPRFYEVGRKLRNKGYNIISPAELDDPDTEAAALASPDGAPGSGTANDEAYEDFLRRDLIVCSLPTCRGIILLEGWENSRGVRGGESWIVSYLKLDLFEYHETEWHTPVLVQIDRDEHLVAAGFDLTEVGAVPKDAPGVRTAASRDQEVESMLKHINKHVEQNGRVSKAPALALNPYDPAVW